MFSLILTLAAVLGSILYLERKVMSTKQEVLDAIAASATQLAKAKAEILAKIAELEAAGENGANWDEILARLTEIKSAAQGLDDIVKDPVPEDPPQA